MRPINQLSRISQPIDFFPSTEKERVPSARCCENRRRKSLPTEILLKAFPRDCERLGALQHSLCPAQRPQDRGRIAASGVTAKPLSERKNTSAKKQSECCATLNSGSLAVPLQPQSLLSDLISWLLGSCTQRGGETVARDSLRRAGYKGRSSLPFQR